MNESWNDHYNLEENICYILLNDVKTMNANSLQ
jgi:hypothetical protein